MHALSLSAMQANIPFSCAAGGLCRIPARRSWPAVCFAGVALVAAHGACATDSPFAPTGAFAQTGVAGDTVSATAGLAWHWDRQWTIGAGVVTGYWAAAISAWRYPAHGGAGNATLGQLSFTPVFRYTPLGGRADWFVEGGIGATYMNRIYATNGKSFSTRFNFGDQIAIGASFGADRRYEITLRYEHFSNANLDTPNPGENFVQVRLATRLP